MYKYAYMHAIAISEKGGLEFEREHGGIWEGLEGEKERDKHCNSISTSTTAIPSYSMVAESFLKQRFRNTHS